MENKFLQRDVTEDIDIFIKTGFFGRIFDKKYKLVKKELESLSLQKLSHSKYIEILKEKKLYGEYILQQQELNEEIIYLRKQETYSLDDLDQNYIC